MLNVITNIILSMMVTLSSKCISYFRKKSNDTTILCSFIKCDCRNEKQNSFLNKEFNVKTVSTSIQKVQTSDNDLSASYLDKIETPIDNLINEASNQKIVALKNLQTAISQKNELEQIDLVTSNLKKI